LDKSVLRALISLINEKHLSKALSVWPIKPRNISEKPKVLAELEVWRASIGDY